jgi:hypothetical protein
MVKLIIALGLLLGPATATAFERLYVWSVVSEGVAQFGIPDTDDANLVVFCDRASGLSLAGSLMKDASIGKPVTLILSGQGFSARRTAVVSECDGLCFSMPVERDDPAIKTLLAGRMLTLEQAGERWTVSGRGAAPILHPLIKACGVSRRK